MDGQRRTMRKQFAMTAMRVMLIFPVFAWWNGFLYPDLTFRNGICKAYTDDGEERKEVTGREFYEELLKAEPERIRVKSRLLEIFFDNFILREERTG